MLKKKMKPDTFNERNQEFIESMNQDSNVLSVTREWFMHATKYEYSYHFNWLGSPIIQFPQDIMAVQEIIWRVRPDLIVETGIARGGSLIFYASMLELLGTDAEVVGIDIDIRAHNRKAIEAHPMNKRITMLEGPSTDESIVNEVRNLAHGKERVLVALDSNHTHSHVLRELELYSPLVRKGSYLIVFDTVIEDMPEHLYTDRPWAKGDNPKTAVWEFLRTNDRFEVDKGIENKLLITVAPDGYLRCVKN